MQALWGTDQPCLHLVQHSSSEHAEGLQSKKHLSAANKFPFPCETSGLGKEEEEDKGDFQLTILYQLVREMVITVLTMICWGGAAVFGTEWVKPGKSPIELQGGRILI